MSGPYSYEVRVRSDAPPEAVFALLADGARWSDWAGPLAPNSSWEREGSPDAGGVGAIRKLGAWPVFSREEIVEYDPPRQLTYTLLSGQPVRNYRAEVELTPVEDGTQIAWRSRFEPLIPGTGPLLRWFLSRIIGAMARRLAAHAGAGAARG